MYGIDIVFEPRASKSQTYHESMKSNDTMATQIKSQNIKSNNNMSTAISDETGLSFIAEWVEVLVLSLRVNAYDINISLNSGNNSHLVLQFSEIQFINASNDEFRNETSLSMTTKLRKTTSKSIFDEKLNKVSNM